MGWRSVKLANGLLLKADQTALRSPLLGSWPTRFDREIECERRGAMTIRVDCPHCNVPQLFDDLWAGKVVNCYQCHRPFLVVLERPVPEPPTPPEVPPAPTPPVLNPSESFVWWQQRRTGHTFPFKCQRPTCPVTIQLRHRVAQAKRKCPGCGQAITLEAIDKQLELMEPERQRILFFLQRQRRSKPQGCATPTLVLSFCCSAISVWRFWFT